MRTQIGRVRYFDDRLAWRPCAAITKTFRQSSQMKISSCFKRAVVPCVMFPSLAVAQPANVLNSSDLVWVLISTALVLFMTLPGLALFYAGLVRSKNVLSLISQCFAITALGSLLWFACGYSIAFGAGGAEHQWWGGLSKVALLGVGRDGISGTIPEYLFFLFQLTFAVITPALIVGAFAERVTFAGVLCFSLLWLLLAYAPVAHWVWGGGWLAKLGVMDFAGGIVVHVTAGSSALVAALYLGPRRGFPHVSMPPHSLPITACGAGMLWVGWFGFNGGSALMANTSAVSAVLATHLGAAAGATGWMIMEWLRYPEALRTRSLDRYGGGLGYHYSCVWFRQPIERAVHWRVCGGGVFFCHPDFEADTESGRFAGCLSGAWCWRRSGFFADGYFRFSRTRWFRIYCRHRLATASRHTGAGDSVRGCVVRDG
jgi:hypothetical protein